MRHALHVSGLTIALISGGFTLGGVALTFGGTFVRDWRRARRDEHASRDAAVRELLAASVDLGHAVQVLRGGWGQRTATRGRLLAGATVLRTLPELQSRKDVTSYPVLRAFLSATRDIAMEQNEDSRRLALDYTTVIVPRTSRFYAAVTALTLGTDRRLADAARRLAEAGGELVEAAAARRSKHTAARERFERELGAFRKVVDKRSR